MRSFIPRRTGSFRHGFCGFPVTVALALALWLRSDKESWRANRRVSLSILAVVGVVWSNFTPETYASTVAKAKRLWVASYLSTRDLHAANQASNHWVYFQNPDSPDIAEKLRWLEQHQLSFFRPPAEKKPK